MYKVTSFPAKVTISMCLKCQRFLTQISNEVTNLTFLEQLIQIFDNVLITMY